MHHTFTSTVRSAVSELQTLLHSVLARYGTLVRLVRTFKQRTNLPYPLPSQKVRTVRTYRTFYQKLRRTISYFAPYRIAILDLE